MKTINTESIKTWIKNFARKQITVRKDGKAIFEIPAPAAVLAFCCFSKITVLGIVAALVMGYGFSFGEKTAKAAPAAEAACEEPVYAPCPIIELHK